MKTTVYLDTLDAFAAARVRRLPGPLDVVTVLGPTPAGRRALRTGRADVSVDHESVDMQSRAPQGGGLWYAHHDVARRLARAVEALLGPPPAAWTEFGLASHRAAAARRQLIALDIHRAVLLGLMAKRRAGGSPAVVFAATGGLAAALTEAAGSILPGIRFVDLPTRRHSAWARLAHLVLVQAACAAGAAFERRRALPPPTVAVEYARGIRRDQGLSDAWPFDGSDLPPDRLLVYFDRPKKAPATHGTVAEVLARGARAVVLSGRSDHAGAPRRAYAHARAAHAVRDLRRTARLWSATRASRAATWERSAWLRMLTPVRRWQAFLETENVKVVADSAETALDALALACDLADATKVGVHWSDVVVPQNRITPLQHVYFTWGPRFSDVVEELDGAPEAIVESGSVFDRKDERGEWSERAKRHRDALSETPFVLAVLDRSAGRDTLVPPRYHVAFYDAILGLAESDARVGLLVKPKSGSVYALSPDVTTRLERLVKGRRARVLAPEDHVLDAAFAADLVVALGVNSAAYLAACAHRPVLVWSPCDLEAGPAAAKLARAGWTSATLAARTTEDLVAAICAKLDDGRADVGDASALVARGDPFRDGRSLARIGSLVAAVLHGADQGLRAADARRAALDAYACEWGADRVRSAGRRAS